MHWPTALTPMLAVMCALTGCSEPLAPAPTLSTTTAAGVNPANIKRIRSLLPTDYEITELRGPVSVAASWGFGSGWTAEPAQCGRLIDPAPDDASTQGFAASGTGGIVYVVVSRIDHATIDSVVPALADDCRQWTLAFGHTTGTFEVASGVGVGSTGDERILEVTGRALTAVESGTQTHTQIGAAYAYLDGYVVEVSLITDPGSGHVPLGADFVTDLLDKATAVLRR